MADLELETRVHYPIEPNVIILDDTEAVQSAIVPAEQCDEIIQAEEIVRTEEVAETAELLQPTNVHSEDHEATELDIINEAQGEIQPLRPQMPDLAPAAEGPIFIQANKNKSTYKNKICLILTFLLSILFTSLTVGMWLTNTYNIAVLKFISIRDDIQITFDNWRYIPTKPRLLVYIFNYTNGDAFLRGEVPKVVELGPYIFSEEMERTNIVFNRNGTVSFQEIRHIKPLAQLLNISLNDSIMVPNMPLLVAIAAASKLDYGAQKILSFAMHMLGADLITNVKVNDFIWGKSDEFFKFLQTVKVLMGEDLQPFGFLAKRKGVHHDIVTMKTGKSELNHLGLITRWNGASTIGIWGNTSCDIMESSDGSMFPARLVYEKKPLYVYAHSMCRRIPLHFNKTTLSKDGFPVHQYNVANDMFDYTGNEENKCYKYEGEYPRKGVFNIAPCNNGMPFYTSFPHFWKGEPSLREDVLGLNPNEEKHESYFHIHEKLGVSLLVKTRFQLNIVLKKPLFLKELSHVKKDNLILPVAWLEYDTGDLQEKFVNVMYHMTYTVRYVEELLKWTLVLLSLASITVFSLKVKKYRE